MNIKVTFMVVLLFFAGTFIFRTAKDDSKSHEVITVYQSRTCGCCKKWVLHLQNSGFEVKSVMMDDVAPIKEKLGVPKNLESCHTATARGLIIEGHVPSDAIRKILAGPGNVKGLSVPGMPIGSPGMEGNYAEKYNVISFTGSNVQTTFMTFN